MRSPVRLNMWLCFSVDGLLVWWNWLNIRYFEAFDRGRRFQPSVLRGCYSEYVNEKHSGEHSANQFMHSLPPFPPPTLSTSLTYLPPPPPLYLHWSITYPALYHISTRIPPPPFRLSLLMVYIYPLIIPSPVSSPANLFLIFHLNVTIPHPPPNSLYTKSQQTQSHICTSMTPPEDELQQQLRKLVIESACPEEAFYPQIFYSGCPSTCSFRSI